MKGLQDYIVLDVSYIVKILNYFSRFTAVLQWNGH